jgi:hypothetical protein
MVKNRKGRRLAAVAEDCEPLAGIARDGSKDIETDIREGRRRNARRHGLDLRHVSGKLAHDGSRQDREAADAGKHEDIACLRFAGEDRNALDEGGGVGEIQIVNLERDAGFHDRIGIVAVDLERTRSIDDDFGRGLAQLRQHVAVPIKSQRFESGATAQAGAEIFRCRVRATGDQQRQSRIVRKQLRKPAAEIPISAENQNPGHARNRPANCGSVT